MNLLRLLPHSIRQKIEHRAGLGKILDNVGWLLFDKILRMGVGLLASVWLARYLGPEQFGQLNYAIAFVGIFGAVAGLGLNGIVVRDIVREPKAANTTLGTAFVLQILGGMLAVALAIGSINWIRPDDAVTKMMVAILGMGLVFKAAEVVKYWFESQVQSRFAVWVENCIFLVATSIKVAMILQQASLMAFVWITLIETALVAVGLMVIYAKRVAYLGGWQPSIARAKSLLSDSWPLVLSGLAIMVYMRIDQIMLGQMLGDNAVGIYSAALRISEGWYFIPLIIVASLFPSIIEAKKQSEVLYDQRLQRLYNLMVLLALGVAIPMTFLSDWVITILFGAAYIQAGAVLTIHIWTGVFVFLGVASGSWYLSENLQLLAFYRTLLGAAVNIAANMILIPRYGVAGAATGTILAQVAAAYLFDFFHAKTRNTFWMKTKSLVSFYRWN